MFQSLIGRFGTLESLPNEITPQQFQSLIGRFGTRPHGISISNFQFQSLIGRFGTSVSPTVT